MAELFRIGPTLMMCIHFEPRIITRSIRLAITGMVESDTNKYFTLLGLTLNISYCWKFTGLRGFNTCHPND